MYVSSPRYSDTLMQVNTSLILSITGHATPLLGFIVAGIAALLRRAMDEIILAADVILILPNCILRAATSQQILICISLSNTEGEASTE